MSLVATSCTWADSSLCCAQKAKREKCRTHSVVLDPRTSNPVWRPSPEMDHTISNTFLARNISRAPGSPDVPQDIRFIILIGNGAEHETSISLKSTSRYSPHKIPYSRQAHCKFSGEILALLLRTRLEDSGLKPSPYHTTAWKGIRLAWVVVVVAWVSRA